MQSDGQVFRDILLLISSEIIIGRKLMVNLCKREVGCVYKPSRQTETTQILQAVLYHLAIPKAV